MPKQKSAKNFAIMALSQIRFCKKFLGSLFFGDAVDKDIHEEPKNKITTKFAAKGRICDSAIIFFPGISSGLPLALILSTIKALLLDKGFSLETIGFFSLVSLPYTLKIFFAPIIDSYKLPFLSKFFSQKKSWIILAQFLLGVFMAILGVASIGESLVLITIFAVLIALVSATQDVVIDGYRVELIEKENQGLAASFYIYGYRIGMLISGAGALALSEIWAWNAVFFMMATLMISTILITIFANETPQNLMPKHVNSAAWFQGAVVAPFIDFAQQQKWLLILAFIIFFKLSDSFAGNLTLPFLLELGFSKLEYASIVKTFGLFATLFGVFVGGILVKKIGIKKSLWLATSAQMLSNLAFCYLTKIGQNIGALYGVISVENLSGGIGDAVFVAYLSSLCSKKFSATQYALLASCASLTRSVLSSNAGIFAQSLGWYQFFIFSTFLSLPSLIFLFLLKNADEKGT